MKGKSKLTVEQRNSWRTPLNLFYGIETYYGIRFDMDVAASHENHLCPVYLTKDDDSLSVNWSEHGKFAWLNPPYSNISPWVDKAIEQREFGVNTVMLVPNSTDTGWFLKAKSSKVIVDMITGGRVAFHHPVTGELKSINTGGSMLLFFSAEAYMRDANFNTGYPIRDRLLALGDERIKYMKAA